MKKITLAVITLLFVSTAIGQSFESEIQLVQSIYGKEKKDIINEFVELDDHQKSDFWILYDEYEVKRNKLGKEKFNLIMNYVNDYGDIEAQDAEIFMKKLIPLRKDSDKLIDAYYKKIKKKTDPVVALQFYQIENYLADLIRLELLEEIYTTKQ